MEQPHANQSVLQRPSTFCEGAPNLVHPSLCVRVAMVTLYGTMSACQEQVKSNSKAYARDELRPKSMLPPGFTVKK